MSDNILSLCYVSKRTDKYTQFCRIADLVDGDFIPYTYSGTDFYDTDRDLIYGPPTMLQAELESIGVYEWSSYLSADNKWQTKVNKAEDFSWCEVLFTKYGTIEELVRAIKSGFLMPKYDRLHDLILCCRASGNKCEAIYISTADAVYRDGKLCLLDSVITLPRDTLDTRYGTGDCKCRYSPYDARKYLARKDACHVVGTVEVKSKDEVVGDIVKQIIGKDVLSRKERQAARTALDNLALPTIVEIVAERFQCSNECAEKYVKEYISRVQERIDSTTSLQWIEMLIENDSDSSQRMRAAVQKQWEETQQQQIKDAQQRQAEAEAALNAVRQQITDAEKALGDIETRQTEAEEKVEELLLLQEEIDAEIQKKLEKFKTDYASALVENAAFVSTILPRQQSGEDTVAAPYHANWAITLPENGTDMGTLEENIDVAVENWEEICADQDMARGLTLFSFAAYARRQPLLVVGEGDPGIGFNLIVDLRPASNQGSCYR